MANSLATPWRTVMRKRRARKMDTSPNSTSSCSSTYWAVRITANSTLAVIVLLDLGAQMKRLCVLDGQIVESEKVLYLGQLGRVRI